MGTLIPYIWKVDRWSLYWIDALNFNYVSPVKSLDSAKQFLVISAVDEDLCVVLDRLCEDGERASVEFFLFPCCQLIWGHLPLGLLHHTSPKNRRKIRLVQLQHQRSRLRRPISKICMILLMDTKIWMTSLIIMFVVRPICVQHSIFKMSSESPEHRLRKSQQWI